MHSARNTKRMISIGLSAYVLSFVVGLVVGYAFGIESFDGVTGAISQSLWYAAMASAGLIMYLCVKWYFMDLEVVPSIREGLIMGAVILGIGFLIDMLLLAVAAFSGEVGTMLSFYLNPLFILTVVFSLGVAGLVGFEEALRRAAVRTQKEDKKSAGKKKKHKKKEKNKK